MEATKIQDHEGNKYIREIHSCDPTMPSTLVDVYAIIECFDIRCPARQHALKKLLCAGIRGKGDEVADLVGVLAATNRAIELQKRRQNAKTS